MTTTTTPQSYWQKTEAERIATIKRQSAPRRIVPSWNVKAKS